MTPLSSARPFRRRLPAKDQLYLPRAATHSTPLTEQRDRSGLPPHGTETILVVEDNPDVRRLVRRQLTELGYTVHESGNGPEALKLLHSAFPIDLMFTDVIMPEGMTGYELASMARECRPGMKILFTSGYTAIAGGLENDSRAGGTLLSKPYRKRDLAHLLRATLDEPA